MRQLLVNSIKCPDGTVLTSRHVHDFQSHTQEDGRSYFVDGGCHYQRIGYSDEEYLDCSLYSDDPHEVIRSKFIWTSFGRSGKEEPTHTALEDIGEKHLKALLNFPTSQTMRQVFQAEWLYRGGEKLW